jgi:hypothetical protein
MQELRHGIACLSVLLGVGTLTASPAAADCWDQWVGNGHFYLAVHRPGGVNWATAEAHAVALGGHLASINSAAENTFVFNLVASPQFWFVVPNPTRTFGPWLGGFQPAGTAEPLGGWTWSDGSAWNFSNWSGGEPNNWQGAQEDHLHYFVTGTTIGPKWNDILGTAQMRGYVIELTAVPPSQPADITCDATVGADDIAVLLGAWGQVGPSPADVDGDGIVGALDLSIVLAEFGWPFTP